MNPNYLAVYICVAILTLTLVPVGGHQAWNWQPVAASPGPATWFSTAFVIGTRGYVAAGYSARNELWQYQREQRRLVEEGGLSGKSRGAAIAFAVNDKGYFGLGYGSSERFADLWEDDPGGDRWTQKLSLPGAVRDHSMAFVIDGKAYVAGGMTCGASEDDCRDLTELWEYDPPTDRWTRRADLPKPAGASAAFVVNRRGYIVGGNQGRRRVNDVSEYDPRSDTWAAKASFPGRERFRAVGFSFDGHGYVGTGLAGVADTSADVLSDFWRYDPLANAWTSVTAFGGPARGAAVAFVLGRTVYLGTGTNATRDLLRDFWSATLPEVFRHQACARHCEPVPWRSTGVRR